MNILRNFRNGLFLGCTMSAEGDNPAGAGGLNTPTQPALSSQGGEVKSLGGVTQVVAGQDPKDISALGSAAAETNIDPKTGLPKTAEVLAAEKAEADKNKPAAEADKDAINPNKEDGTPKTPEEIAAEKTAKEAEKAAALEADKVPEGSKTGFTNKEIAEAKANAEKTDPRFVPYTAEFMVQGDLSAESVTKAAKDFGVSEEIVKAWISGQKAEMQIGKAAQAVEGVQTAEAKLAMDKTITSIQTIAGGEEQWGQFAKWANANLSEDDLGTLTAAINTNNKGIYTLAINDALAKYKAAGGGEGPRDLTKNSTAQTNQPVQGFASLAEQTAAINDPKYRSDPAYRDLVGKRIAQSRF